MKQVILVRNRDKVDRTVEQVVLPATVRLVGTNGVKKSSLVNDVRQMKAVLLAALSSSEADDQVQVESRKGAR